MASLMPLPRGGPSSSYMDVPPLPRQRRSAASPESSASSASFASGSSTFLDRMKGRGGYVSSRTSMEDEYEPRKEMRYERGGELRQRRVVEPESETGDVGGGDERGYGISLWSQVAMAANSLTISVSKAWTSNIAAYSGERTPPGEESRLTRAMKAYHIEKARDPTDLPPWLFEEHERRPLGQSSTRSRHREGAEYGGHQSRNVPAPAPPRGRGLRDIYDTAAAETPRPSHQETRESPRIRRDDVPAGPPSKANDRLKALRDAKRNATIRRNSPASSDRVDTTGGESFIRVERSRNYGQERGQGYNRAPSLPASVRPVGLPPRPAIRRY
ncbi:hypothetical protein BJV78DRAFT_1167964 [Lactifluus subvellereus]|nr:hypothetical protein BJV78DRAFT_1167964 [Lactifluus subvellereus]